MLYDVQVRPVDGSGYSYVDIPELDDEHRGLLQIGGEIGKALQEGAGPSKLRAITATLIRCLEEHFTHEEMLMRRSRYSGYRWHKGQHDVVRRRAKDEFAALERGEAQAAGRLVEYLFRWIQDHTSLSDRMLAATLRNQSRGL